MYFLIDEIQKEINQHYETTGKRPEFLDVLYKLYIVGRFFDKLEKDEIIKVDKLEFEDITENIIISTKKNIFFLTQMIC